MKTRRLLVDNNLHSTNMASCSKLFTLMILMTTIVIQLNSSSSSYIVNAKSFTNPHNATIGHTDAMAQMQPQPNNQGHSLSSFTDNQSDNNINNNPITSTQQLQSTTNSRPEAAAVSSPSTSHLKPPVIVSKSVEVVVAPGSNVTLYCSAHGSQPMTFVWFQDEKNITGNTNSSSTRLLEEKRYEIFEEIGEDSQNITTSILYLMDLRITDTSLFLCCVDNPAGYTFSNYSLIVSESAQQSQTLSSYSTNSYQTATNSLHNNSYPMIVIGLIVFLFAITICISLQIYNCRHESASDQNIVSKKQASANGGDNFSNKSSSQHDKKSLNSNSPSGLNNGGKYTPVSVGSDEDEDEGVDDDLSQTSSCNKNNLRVLAVNDLEGFIEQMRSGIINMDYHSMSPVIQFNKTDSLNQTQSTTNLNNTNTSTIRPQSAMMAHAEQQPFQQIPQQQQQQQQIPYQQQLRYQQSRHPFNQQSAYPLATSQATIANFQMQPQQTPYQQPQPFHHHLQQQQQQQQSQPLLNQPYHPLAYMNHVPSSSSSSSQTPFTNYGAGGDGYYY